MHESPRNAEVVDKVSRYQRLAELDRVAAVIPPLWKCLVSADNVNMKVLEQLEAAGVTETECDHLCAELAAVIESPRIQYVAPGESSAESDQSWRDALRADPKTADLYALLQNDGYDIAQYVTLSAGLQQFVGRDLGDLSQPFDDLHTKLQRYFQLAEPEQQGVQWSGYSAAMKDQVYADIVESCCVVLMTLCGKERITEVVEPSKA